MKSFEYAAPKTLKEATELLSDSWGKTEIMAGGTDLVTSLKQRISQPERVVSLRNIPELRGVKPELGGYRIGAMTTLEDLASNSDLTGFKALITAARGVVSPQLQSVGTVGGDLCQRPRCWYFRNGHGLLARRDGKSLVRDGDNRYHAIFGNDGPALFVSPSSLAPALLALESTFTLTGPGGKTRVVPAADFFRTPKAEGERETVLKPNEILTSIFVSQRSAPQNATYEVRHRHGLDWPYVTASVAMTVRNGEVAYAKVVLGHVAPTPWVATAAAKALNGSAPTEIQAAKAAEAAVTGAKPLSGNAYKIQMVKAAVKRAVLAAAAS